MYGNPVGLVHWQPPFRTAGDTAAPTPHYARNVKQSIARGVRLIPRGMCGEPAQRPSVRTLQGRVRGGGRYRAARESKEERAEIACAAHAGWTQGGSRISTGERPVRRGVERWISVWSREHFGNNYCTGWPHTGMWSSVMKTTLQLEHSKICGPSSGNAARPVSRMVIARPQFGQDGFCAMTDKRLRPGKVPGGPVNPFPGNLSSALKEAMPT
jgi:hypothetical protein